MLVDIKQVRLFDRYWEEFCKDYYSGILSHEQTPSCIATKKRISVVNKYFGYNGNEIPTSLTKLAEKLGVSNTRVQQVIKKEFLKMTYWLMKTGKCSANDL